ncbi:MAG: metallophosphoesterase family protein [Candidatus Hadarchaeales archaeon]
MISKLGRVSVLKSECKNVLIAGDIHGDFNAFKRALEIFEETPDSILIFLGDYADRGDMGLEVIETLTEMIGPRVVALKGNHEDYVNGSPTFHPWDFGWEVEMKRKVKWKDFFPIFEKNFLNKLSIAFVIPGLALCVHGGICGRIKSLNDLKAPNRKIEECILWSDPTDLPGEFPNPRGAGILFGPDITDCVLKSLDVKFLIRSHEPMKASEGPFLEQGGRVITLSTTSVYGGKPFLLRINPYEKFDLTKINEKIIFL